MKLERNKRKLSGFLQVFRYYFYEDKENIEFSLENSAHISDGSEKLRIYKKFKFHINFNTKMMKIRIFQKEGNATNNQRKQKMDK